MDKCRLGKSRDHSASIAWIESLLCDVSVTSQSTPSLSLCQLSEHGSQSAEYKYPEVRLPTARILSVKNKNTLTIIQCQPCLSVQQPCVAHVLPYRQYAVVQPPLVSLCWHRRLTPARSYATGPQPTSSANLVKLAAGGAAVGFTLAFMGGYFSSPAASTRCDGAAIPEDATTSGSSWEPLHAIENDDPKVCLDIDETATLSVTPIIMGLGLLLRPSFSLLHEHS